jgi:hypothetical protein
MTGSDLHVISSSDFHWAHATGIGESTITDFLLVAAAGFLQTHLGSAIVFMNQYASYGKGHTIHSTAFILAFGTQVHDSQHNQGGEQCLITSEGYHAPLSYGSGLLYMNMRPPTDTELQQLPHIILTSDTVWVMMNSLLMRSSKMHPLMQLFSILTLLSLPLASTLAIFKMTLI